MSIHEAEIRLSLWWEIQGDIAAWSRGLAHALIERVPEAPTDWIVQMTLGTAQFTQRFSADSIEDATQLATIFISEVCMRLTCDSI